jgi:hypothetical protein
MKLIVTQPFGGHAVGAQITDAAQVSLILASEQAHCVVKVADNTAAPIAAPSSEAAAPAN